MDKNSCLPKDEPIEELRKDPQDEKCRALKNMFFLATAYGANLGGTGSMTGTGPNLVLRGLLLRLNSLMSKIMCVRHIFD